MKKKLLVLAAIVGLQLLTMPSWAKDTVVIERITQSEAETLDIQIPEDVPPGHHEVQIEVSDDAGVLSTQTLKFCKTAKGIIKWDDLCPGELAPFNPADDPIGTTGLAVAALSILGAIGGSKNETDSSGESSGSSEGDVEQSSLEAIETGELEKIKRKPGWGDRLRTWRFPLTSLADREFGLAAFQFSRFSPLMHRLIIDGTYLRSMIGSVSYLLYPAAFIVASQALHTAHFKALPATLGLTMAGILIGLLDAYAGFFAAFLYFGGVFLSGNIDSRHSLLTTVGYVMLWFVPGLLASAFRPLRREVKDFASFWERATDYALAALLMGWGVQKMVYALGGLSGYKVTIMPEANKIAIFAAIVLVGRMLLEEFVTYGYPVRTNALHEESEPQDVHSRHTSVVIVFRAVLFNLTAELFIGNSLELWIGTALFVLPSIIERYTHYIPEAAFKGKFLPTGAVKTVIMILIGTYFANVLASQIEDPYTYLRSAFVVLTIPTVIIGAMYAMANSERDASSWQRTALTRYSYRLLGICVYFVLVLIVKGSDVVGAIQGWFGN